jgi:hypothetical protein
MARLGCGWKRSVIGNGCVVRYFPAARADFLENSALVACVATWGLAHCCLLRRINHRDKIARIVAFTNLLLHVCITNMLVMLTLETSWQYAVERTAHEGRTPTSCLLSATRRQHPNVSQAKQAVARRAGQANRADTHIADEYRKRTATSAAAYAL